MNISPENLMDLSLEIGLVPDSKYHYRWKELSDWQLDSILKLGLKKDSYLLDVGCGGLRFGIRAIDYLESKHYYGVDAITQFLRLGKLLVEHFKLEKEYTVLHSTEFEFEKFNMKFDYANAQSVFTHLNHDQIEKCIGELKKVMNTGGKFLFTYTHKNLPYGFLYNDYEPVIAGVGINDDFIKRMEVKFDIKFINTDITHPYQRVGVFEF